MGAFQRHSLSGFKQSYIAINIGESYQWQDHMCAVIQYTKLGKNIRCLVQLECY